MRSYRSFTGRLAGPCQAHTTTTTPHPTPLSRTGMVGEGLSKRVIIDVTVLWVRQVRVPVGAPMTGPGVIVCFLRAVDRRDVTGLRF
jgi:hypothetical protein